MLDSRALWIHARGRPGKLSLAGLLLIAIWALIRPAPDDLNYDSALPDYSPTSFSPHKLFSGSSRHGKGKRIPWHDLSAIRARTRPASQTVAPLHLHHFNTDTAPDPFQTIYAVSAWLDTRPVVVGMAPQVAVIATMKGAGFMSFPSGEFPEDPVQCFVVVKQKGKRSAVHFVGQTTLNALPDPHEGERDFVTVMYNCALADEDGATIQGWEAAEIYATLSLPTLEPPPDVFLPVTVLAKVDPQEHKTGEGPTAMCMPPLTGDIYAPYLRDFVAHYRALGFEKFYIYLLDPGPKSLAVIRDLALDDEILPVRWTLSKGWLYSQLQQTIPDKGYEVHPSEWDVPGIDELDLEVEQTVGVSQNGEWDVRVWYFAQGAAQQDCTFRAMKDNARWVGANDWDEFLLLRPANNHLWPPPSTSRAPKTSPFVSWARTVERTFSWPEVMHGWNIDQLRLNPLELTRDSLPAAFMFRSSFFCAQCRPTGPPPESEAVQDLMLRHPEVDWTRPGIGVPFAYSGAVRMNGWFPDGSRTKTLINPWAWWSVGIHYPGLGFAEWVNTRGPCSKSFKDEVRSVADTQCSAIFLSLFGPNTVSVVPPPATVMAPKAPIPWGRGALHHFRANKQLTAALERFTDEAERTGSDPVTSAEAVRAFDELRVDEDGWVAEYGGGADESGVIQDWGMVDVMAGVIGDILEAKRERGLTKWLVVKGTSRKRRRGKGQGTSGWRLVGWAAAGGAVLWAVRRRRTRR